MIFKGNNLEIKLGLAFWSILQSNHLQMIKYYPHSKEGQCTYSEQLTNLDAIILWSLGKLCTFHPDLHPSTHVQLKKKIQE